jgi:hypothetical protein
MSNFSLDVLLAHYAAVGSIPAMAGQWLDLGGMLVCVSPTWGRAGLYAALPEPRSVYRAYAITFGRIDGETSHRIHRLNYLRNRSPARFTILDEARQTLECGEPHWSARQNCALEWSPRLVKAVLRQDSGWRESEPGIWIRRQKSGRRKLELQIQHGADGWSLFRASRGRDENMTLRPFPTLEDAQRWAEVVLLFRTEMLK